MNYSSNSVTMPKTLSGTSSTTNQNSPKTNDDIVVNIISTENRSSQRLSNHSDRSSIPPSSRPFIPLQKSCLKKSTDNGPKRKRTIQFSKFDVAEFNQSEPSNVFFSIHPETDASKQENSASDEPGNDTTKKNDDKLKDFEDNDDSPYVDLRLTQQAMRFVQYFHVHFSAFCRRCSTLNDESIKLKEELLRKSLSRLTREEPSSLESSPSTTSKYVYGRGSLGSDFFASSSKTEKNKMPPPGRKSILLSHDHTIQTEEENNERDSLDLLCDDSDPSMSPAPDARENLSRPSIFTDRLYTADDDYETLKQQWEINKEIDNEELEEDHYDYTIRSSVGGVTMMEEKIQDDFDDLLPTTEQEVETYEDMDVAEEEQQQEEEYNPVMHLFFDKKGNYCIEDENGRHRFKDMHYDDIDLDSLRSPLSPADSPLEEEENASNKKIVINDESITNSDSMKSYRASLSRRESLSIVAKSITNVNHTNLLFTEEDMENEKKYIIELNELMNENNNLCITYDDFMLYLSDMSDDGDFLSMHIDILRDYVMTKMIEMYNESNYRTIQNIAAIEEDNAVYIGIVVDILKNLLAIYTDPSCDKPKDMDNITFMLTKTFNNEYVMNILNGQVGDICYQEQRSSLLPTNNVDYNRDVQERRRSIAGIMINNNDTEGGNSRRNEDISPLVDEEESFKQEYKHRKKSIGRQSAFDLFHGNQEEDNDESDSFDDLCPDSEDHSSDDGMLFSWLFDSLEDENSIPEENQISDEEFQKKREAMYDRLANCALTNEVTIYTVSAIKEFSEKVRDFVELSNVVHIYTCMRTTASVFQDNATNLKNQEAILKEDKTQLTQELSFYENNQYFDCFELDNQLEAIKDRIQYIDHMYDLSISWSYDTVLTLSYQHADQGVTLFTFTFPSAYCLRAPILSLSIKDKNISPKLRNRLEKYGYQGSQELKSDRHTLFQLFRETLMLFEAAKKVGDFS